VSTSRSSGAASRSSPGGWLTALALLLGYVLALYGAARHGMVTPIVVTGAVLVAVGLARRCGGRAARWGVAAWGLALLVAMAFEPMATALRYAVPVAVYVVLAAVFGRSLVGGREPLITRFARLQGDVLDPAVLRYTRGVTVVWASFCAVLAIACIALALVLDGGTWSLVANGLNPLLVVMLLAAEFQVRIRRFPDRPHGTFRGFLRQLACADLRALISA